MTVKIMTFNVQHCQNYLTGEIDYERFGQVLRDCGADVVAINEIYSGDKTSRFGNQVARLAELGGYAYSFFAKAILVGSKKSPYGNALLSKIPIVKAEVIPVPDPAPEGRIGKWPYESRCLLKARLENGLTVMAIHIGLNPEEHENALSTVLTHLEERQCALLGDFNVRPDHPMIAAIGERMTDTAICFEKPLLSFPSTDPVKKIDYLFVTPDLHVTAADIPAIVASDHRPHVAVIEQEEGAGLC